LTFEDQASRMRMLRRQVAEHNVYRWAGELLSDAAAAGGPRLEELAALG
jgi:trehalose-6-phosphate synthase